MQINDKNLIYIWDINKKQVVRTLDPGLPAHHCIRDIMMKEGLLACVSSTKTFMKDNTNTDRRVALWSVSHWTLELEIWGQDLPHICAEKTCDFSTKLNIIVTVNGNEGPKSCCINIYSLSGGNHIAKCVMPDSVNNINLAVNPNGETSSYFLIWPAAVNEIEYAVELRKLQTSDHTIVGSDTIPCPEVEAEDIVVSHSSVQVFGCTSEAYLKEFQGKLHSPHYPACVLTGKVLDLQFDLTADKMSTCVSECHLVSYKGSGYTTDDCEPHLMGVGRTYAVVCYHDDDERSPSNTYEVYNLERSCDLTSSKTCLTPRLVGSFPYDHLG